MLPIPPVLPAPTVRAPNPLAFIRPYPDGVRNEAGSGRHWINLIQIVLRISCRDGSISGCYKLLFPLEKKKDVRAYPYTCGCTYMLYLCMCVWKMHDAEKGQVYLSRKGEGKEIKEINKEREGKKKKKRKKGRKGSSTTGNGKYGASIRD